MATRPRLETPDAVTLYATNSSRLLAVMTGMRQADRHEIPLSRFTVYLRNQHYIKNARTWNPRHIILAQALIRRYLARKRYLAIGTFLDDLAPDSLAVNHKTEKRAHIAKEIAETEQSYLQGLRTCVAVFMEPLQRDLRDNPKSSILPADKIQTLFGNMPEIATLHAQLLHDLQARLEHWSSQSRIADIFLRYAPSFTKVYIAYCNNYDLAFHCFQLLCRDPRVQTWFDNQTQLPQNAGAQLPTHLITPVQRLPRYILLLQDMRKNMPRNHPDFFDITKALQEVQAVINLVETTMDNIQQVSKITRMQSRMQGMTESVLATNRKLKYEAPLLLVGDDGIRAGHFYLFTDLLLWGIIKERPRRKDTRTAERPDALLEADEPLMYRGKLAIQSDTVLKEIPDMESVKNAFLVVTGRQSVSVAAETPKEKREWTTHLRNAIASVVGPPTPASEMNLQWSFDISIKGFIARKPPGGGKEYIAFIIEKRAPEGDVTQVERRYSEFAELHQRLTKALPSFKASLPKKTKLFGDLSYEEQQTRRVMLEKYLIEILASNEVTRSSEAITVSKFLSPTETDTFLKEKEKSRPLSTQLGPQVPIARSKQEDRGSGLFKTGTLRREPSSGNFRSATPTGSGTPVANRRPSVQQDGEEPLPRGITKSPMRQSLNISDLEASESTGGEEERPTLGSQRSLLGHSNPDINYGSIGRTKSASGKTLNLLPTPTPPTPSTTPPSPAARGFLSSQRSSPNLLSHSTPVLPALPSGFAQRAADETREKSNTVFGGEGSRSPRTTGPSPSPRQTFSMGSYRQPSPRPVSAVQLAPAPPTQQTTSSFAVASVSATLRQPSPRPNAQAAAQAPDSPQPQRAAFLGGSRRAPPPVANPNP